MSRRYDSKTTTFTPDGRLMQVEYAIEAINKAGSSIGLITQEGIVLATQKMETSSLLEKNRQSEKIYTLDNHVHAVVSGMTADANYLLDYARVGSQEHRFQFGSDMAVEQLVQKVCDLKQNYTQFGGLRPFGAAFLFAGHDRHHGFQLYSSDPSGNYTGWKATALGQNNLAANTFLKTDYAEDLSLSAGLDVALKALCKTLDTAQPTAQKIELAVVERKEGRVGLRFLGDEEVDGLLNKNQLVKQQQDDL